ncbi:hypothetical protein QSJ18_12725 [Gordonia sp. ABSL1-1]|nr:hypothetical protein [Gordonia sp. ABSL1-1]MDL9937612.1 hypothetical protein [Gordonia sp. ABSL1-1]
MATHASTHLRAPRSRTQPRLTYNVGASCRATALSILALAVLFVLLLLI